MEKQNIIHQYQKFLDKSDLTPSDFLILNHALDQLPKAYAPYSNFHVGAAVLLNDGSIYFGCNQENASYPLCICGERVALYNAGVNQPNTPISTLAIVVENQKSFTTGMATPCGACRQVIAEFEMRHRQSIRIILKSQAPEVYIFESIDALLPYSFNKTFL